MARSDRMQGCGAAGGCAPLHPDIGSLPPTPRLRRTRALAATRAFSLIEMLLVIALIALLAGVLVSGARGLLNDKPQTPQEIFWSAVEQARKKALETEGEVTMSFLDEKDKGKSFVLVDNGGSKSLPVPNPGDLEVAFLTTQKGGNMIMIGGTVVETQKVESVRFYPDGTCSPFRIQFLQKGASEVLSIDPWTCAQVLLPGDPNAPSRPSS